MFTDCCKRCKYYLAEYVFVESFFGYEPKRCETYYGWCMNKRSPESLETRLKENYWCPNFTLLRGNLNDK